ncbi:MAG TPA: alpha-galactosidase [Phycisphaerae bacterium]|nr:alpha-galactosidase [Phycisphaerae bacterium]HRR86714.1 alpha-galactosidase [Phycisphaerae bacterium]
MNDRLRCPLPLLGAGMAVLMAGGSRLFGLDFKAESTMWLDDIETAAQAGSQFPFSFTYDDRPSGDLLRVWKSRTSESLPAVAGNSSDPACLRGRATAWTDPNTGLRVAWQVTRFSDFPAIEWLLTFENTGTADTPIIENIQALDVSLNQPLDDRGTYRLCRTNGAPSNPTDFEVRTITLTPGSTQTMSGGGGRSSNKDFPFFKIETKAGSLIVAVGWSGQWAACVSSPQAPSLHLTAGIEKTHFKLLPGEKVRMPRILMLHWEGDTRESNARFRQLIYKHYAAMKAGKKPLPTLFCNTCFTRGGGWLNECNAENQISLIKAYAPLGLEALLTDAGWFTGGWPNGAGNWDPRKDAYPDGMGPVAAAAKAHNMIYGLWFEPERVVAGTSLHKEHPDWVLSPGGENPRTFLADFGRKEVQDYFFNIVRGFMALPGFRVYRQDFNMDPLAYWRHNDAPDRQGITEIKYIEGLYAYWDRIAHTWPDSLREECASGGRRIDLETVMRMHLHQDSDYWFDNDVDQAQIWGLSQYLPNNVFVGHINRMDDYSFHSVMASSLCMGWIADGPDFDKARGKKLLDRYLALRHLLIGAWYPLLPYSRSGNEWIASQYHRPDLDEGMILAFRRAESPYRTTDVSLDGLKPDAVYELTSQATGQKTQAKGADLMKQYQLTIPDRHKSELITYRTAK